MLELKIKKGSLEGTTKVNSLEGLKQGILYETENYELFHNRIDNRGGAIQPRRLNKLLEEIASGRFMFDTYDVKIEPDGLIFDGHHRICALKMTGHPIIFRIVNSHSTDDVARHNSTINPLWSGKDGFVSAVISGYPIAVELTRIKKELNDMGIPNSNIPPSNMYAILSKNSKRFTHKVTREEFNDEKLTKLLQSLEFKRNIQYYAELKMKYSVRPKGYVLIQMIFEHVLSTKNFDYEGYTELLNQYKWETHTANGVFGYRKLCTQLADKLNKRSK